MGSPALLIWSVFFGAFGMGFLIYGRKHKAIVPLCVGVVLCVFPYFMANVYMLIGIGVVLVAIPYFVRV
jgi:hypothetical protein